MKQSFPILLLLIVFSFSCKNESCELIEGDDISFAFKLNSSPSFKGYFYLGSDEDFHYFIERWNYERDKTFKFRLEDLTMYKTFKYKQNEIQADRIRLEGSVEIAYTNYYKLYSFPGQSDTVKTAIYNQDPKEEAKQIQFKTDENYHLEGYRIRHTVVISGKEKLLIASEIPEDIKDSEGLRLLFLIDNEVVYKTEDIGESYIYKPSFFQFTDSTLIIVCEQGFEYSAGIDIYELKNSRISYLGFLNMASNTDDFPASIVPNMIVERNNVYNYSFRFTGDVVIDPEGDNERTVKGDRIAVKENKGKLIIDSLQKTY